MTTNPLPSSLCVSCGTTMTDPQGPVCDRCRTANVAVRELKAATAALEKARSDMAYYAKERTRIATEAVASGVRPATLARGLDLTRQRMNSLLRRGTEG